jgi:hypothetical protein
MQGWIKIHRQILDNEFYFSEKFTKTQAWIDLLLLASHTERTVFIKGVEINLKAGELCYSQRSLATRWTWNPRTVYKFLNKIQKRKMIHHRKNNVTTIITILNWELYQSSTAGNTSQDTSQIQHGIQTNNNDKNVKNENNNKIEKPNGFLDLLKEDFISFYKEEFNERGYNWNGRDSKQLGLLLKNLKTTFPNLDTNGMRNTFRHFLVKVFELKDKWINDNFTISTLNSKYQPLITRIENNMKLFRPLTAEDFK